MKEVILNMNSFYTSIENLPLGKFIDCIVKSNLHALVIEGDPTKEELQEAAENILIEYNQEMLDEEDQYNFNQQKETLDLDLKISQINGALVILGFEIDFPNIVEPEKRYSDDLNKLLRTDFKLDHSNPEQFRAELKRAKSIKNGMILALDVKRASLKAVNEKKEDKGKDKAHNKNYYQSILNTLSQFAGFRLTFEITVMEFCDWVKKSNEHNRQLKQEKNGK